MYWRIITWSCSISDWLLCSNGKWSISINVVDSVFVNNTAVNVSAAGRCRRWASKIGVVEEGKIGSSEWSRSLPWKPRETTAADKVRRHDTKWSLYIAWPAAFLHVNWFLSVLWHCWFGHLACKNRPRNELLCVEWDVKPYTLTHSLYTLPYWPKPPFLIFDIRAL